MPSGMPVCTNPYGPSQENKNLTSYDDAVFKLLAFNIYYGVPC